MKKTVAALVLWMIPSAFAAAGVDLRAVVSRGDLDYAQPALRSDDGQPIGNGRMGSLVWTTPTALHFQINRCDVFAENGATHSFPERHTDYAGGCGFVDIDFGGFGPAAFGGDGRFNQHLSIYDGLASAHGDGVTARIIAHPNRDVFAVEIDDQRKDPSPIDIDLRMLRYAMQYHAGQNASLTASRTNLIRTASHTAASTIDIRDGKILLTQLFHEDQYACWSSVAIAVAGRTSQAHYANDSTVRLSLARGTGKFLILISSAASFDPLASVDLVTEKIDAISKDSFDVLMKQTADWWHDFWAKDYIDLHSVDGEADFVAANYAYFLYLMGSTSRGPYQPRFGGLLFCTNGDMREWGSQYWWANQGCYYNGVQASGHFDLMQPVFDTYTKMYDACARAARQQWGSKGIWIPETVFFDGPENLPDEMAAETRELYLGRKPWEQRSPAFMALADTKPPHNSRWNWKDKGQWIEGHYVWKDRGLGPRGPVVTILSSGAKIAYLYWLQYDYTRDEKFLRERAYPMLKGIAEFYLNYPNLTQGEDRRMHIHDVNNHEPVWGVTDSQEEVCAMQGIVPLAIRAAEILNVDPQFRMRWEELREHLPKLPTSDLLGGHEGDSALHWIGGVPPALSGDPTRPGMLPVLLYDLCTLSSSDAQMRQIAQNTYTATHPRATTQGTAVSVLSQSAVIAARMGRADDVRFMLPSQIRCLAPDHDFCDLKGSGSAERPVLMNRMTLREGPGAIDAERLGRVADALQSALMQSVPPAPGEESVIHLFPAWPKDWDARFRLPARGGFQVSATIRGGEIREIEVASRIGGECRVKNPWPGEVVKVGDRELSGDVLAFATSAGGTIELVREARH